MSSARVQAYLERVLALDPHDQFEQIARLREEFHAATSMAQTREVSGVEPERSSTPSRQELANELATLRERLLELAPEEVESRLERMELAAHPELDRARVRLVAANRARDELALLLEDKHADRTLARQLRQLITADPQSALDLRNRSARTIGRGVRGNHARAFVKLLRKRYPQLAALEPQWLERLQSAKRNFKDARVVTGGLGCIGTFLVIRLVLKLIQLIVDYFQS